ncbi:hypothetical protein J2X84_001551 [Pseudomonas corrugata]|nr:MULTISPECIES: hypothetical protein [Pseudomonas]MDR7282727.1 hypothetical protein [Pseudomonas corrugata]
MSDGEKTQQLTFAGIRCQPLLESAFEVIHVRELDQAFPWRVERDFSIQGAAHGERAGQWNIVCAWHAQRQLRNMHGVFLRGAGCVCRQINVLHPFQVIKRKAERFFAVTGFSGTGGALCFVKKIRQWGSSHGCPRCVAID